MRRSYKQFLAAVLTMAVVAGCSQQPPPKAAGGKSKEKAADAVKSPDAKSADVKTSDVKSADQKSQISNLKSPDTKTPDTKTPDAKTPDAKTPDTKTPDTKSQISDLKSPDASAKKTPDVTETPTKTDEKIMNIDKKPYGKLADGTQIDQYTLVNANGMEAKILTYGATLTSLTAPDREGKKVNVTLFRDSLADYTEMKGDKPTTPYFGATVGRYGNRIAKGKFTLDGKEYKLAVNNGPNHLHGGLKGFDKVVWKAEPIKGEGFVGVAFTYTSVDGEEGYPGTLKCKVTYTLTDKDELKLDYEATTDKATVVNLTNHSYWNLAGAGEGDVLEHVITINADRYLPVDDVLIPLTDAPKPVKGTPMDLTAPKKIGADIAKVEGGYDHCYVLNKKGSELSLAARVVEPKSGRVMEVFTTEPAVQFYTGNFLDGTISGGGKNYDKHFGLCLEAEHYPNSPNRPDFPSVVLKPGETYKQTTVHKFSVDKK